MSMVPGDGLQAGFETPEFESQSIFRMCLLALSRPGRPVSVRTNVAAVGPLRPATAAILLALADYETTVWLDHAANEDPHVASFLRFHTGAPIVKEPELADFALALDPSTMPSLAVFKQGIPDYPDRSTTLLLQVDRICDTGARATGPGINGSISFSAEPLPHDFAQQLAINRRSFPCGVDIILVAPSEIVGLPRSTTIVTSGER